MKISEFLKLVSQPGRLNYFVICPDDLGLQEKEVLPKALRAVVHPDDTHYHDAETITKEKARQIEVEARTAARSGSELQVFYIYSLQKLPTDSVGPLLKAVEDAKSSRFIFQAQSVPRKIHTLMSRSSVVRLPFMRKQVVLANIKKMERDARAVDEGNLYDGTLTGSLTALAQKDTIAVIKREISKGVRGIAAVFQKDVLDSVALDRATYDMITEPERRFLGKNPSWDRRKIVLYLAMARAGK